LHLQVQAPATHDAGRPFFAARISWTFYVERRSARRWGTGQHSGPGRKRPFRQPRISAAAQGLALLEIDPESRAEALTALYDAAQLVQRAAAMTERAILRAVKQT